MEAKGDEMNDPMMQAEGEQMQDKADQMESQADDIGDKVEDGQMDMSDAMPAKQ